MIVPLLHLLDNLIIALNVLGIWVAPLHLFRTVSHPQVVPGTDEPEVVAETTKQASSCVTLLFATLVRERTFQEIVGLHVYYCCMVFLCPRGSSLVPFTTSDEDISMFPSSCFEVIWEGSVYTRVERGTERDKKKSNFFTVLVVVQ